MATKRHLDAAETVFFQRELEAIETEMLDVAKIPLKALEFLGLVGSGVIRPHDKLYTYRQREYLGRAERRGPGAEDAPLVNVKYEEKSQKFQEYMDGFHYSTDEIAAAAAEGRPLDRDRAFAAREVLAAKLDDVLSLGDTQAGLVGFLNLSGTTTYNIPADGTGSSPLWVNKSADQILRDLNQVKAAVRTGTSEVEAVKRILLPPAADELISNTARSATSDTTIKEFFLKNNPGMEIMSWDRLTTAGPSSGGLILAYDPNPLKVGALLPVAFEQSEPERDGFQWKVVCRNKTGGVITKFPKSVCYSAANPIV
jgi:hypothetical protein